MAKKNYVLDTNVLIHDPKSIYHFDDNNVYIPIYVLEEIDKFKNEQTERGSNAREAIRYLDNLRIHGQFTNGIDINNGGKLFVYIPPKKLKLECAVQDVIDNYILQSVLNIKESNTQYNTIFVTMDINLRVRAEALGLQVAAYEFTSVDVSNLGNEVIDITVDSSIMEEFHKNNFITLSVEEIEKNNIIYNSCVMLSNGPSSGLCRFYTKQGNSEPTLNKIILPKNVFGLKPRNREQIFALDMLLDDNIKLVTIMGVAGCGKSLLATCAGLWQVQEEKSYAKLLVSRPVIPMGKDIGYLPGTIEEKLEPWMKPIYDNIDYLMISSKTRQSCNDLFSSGIIEIEPLTYIRGRSISHQFIIIDEAQGLTSHEIKTIITRCGENCKIIFTGDINQIDNPYVSKTTNGLTILTKTLKNNKLISHIALSKGERSELATLAANNL